MKLIFEFGCRKNVGDEVKNISNNNDNALPVMKLVQAKQVAESYIKYFNVLPVTNALKIYTNLVSFPFGSIL